MTTHTIPVCSARTVIPFLSFMRDRGAPVDRWVEQSRLPGHMHEDPDRKSCQVSQAHNSFPASQRKDVRYAG
jgi:hypothetical protein